MIRNNMREIKFRVWSNRKKGYLNNERDNPNDNSYHVEGNVNEQIYCIARFLGEHDGEEDAILEQYTGLKDKNGKEIYEGDIVRIYNNTLILANDQKEFDAIHFVYWGHLGFQFTLVNGEYMQGCGRFSEPQYEVIGNIHENPVLLKNHERLF